MRDHRFVPAEGPAYFVSEMPLHLIPEALRDGVEVFDPDGPGETAETVMERLRLEVYIRENGL